MIWYYENISYEDKDLLTRSRQFLVCPIVGFFFSPFGQLFDWESTTTLI